MKVGITQYAASPSGQRFLERTAELGLAGVEPYIGDADSEFLSWSEDDIERLVTRAEELGVSVPSVAMSVFLGDSSLVDSEGRDKAVRLTRRALNFSAAVGAKVMLLCTYFASHPDTPAKKANLLEVIHEIEPEARRLGVAIALESPLPAEELAQLVDATGSDQVGVYYDVGNAVYLGFDPASEIEMLAQRILSVHVKDTAQMLGDSHLGKGRLDLAASIHTLKRIGYDGWLILETPGGDPTALHEDIKLLRQHL